MKAAVATMQGNIGFTYDSLGLYRRARRFCERAAAYAHRLRNLPAQLNVPLVNLAHTAVGLGDQPGAAWTIEEALPASREAGDRSVEVLTVMLQGRGSAARRASASGG